MFSNLTPALSALVWTYAAFMGLLMIYGLHRYWILFLYWRHHKKSKNHNPVLSAHWRPHVTVQLPLYNEMYVAERLIEAVAAFDYPKDKLEIQVLDDSTDETVSIVAKKVEALKANGIQISHLRRPNRSGFKAGALAQGLLTSRGEFVAIFDADFVPPADFLLRTLPYFSNPNVGMVQARWGHLNASYSLLTRLQALFLDGHFQIEHTARHKSGAFFNFNGTAGIWRKVAIETAGGWSARTLTEDLDLSYRAQLYGWKFVYDPDLVCPAELPVDILAFQSQQRRWTKGAIQVARHLLKDIWKAKLPFHTKIEATAHLTANLGYVLTVIVAVLILPSLFLRELLNTNMSLIELGIFLCTTLSVVVFYATSQRELYPDWKKRLKDFPALFSLGIGMCLVNARAVLEGLFGYESDFVRTPKYNITRKRESWSKKNYVNRKQKSVFVPLVFAIYSSLTLMGAIFTNHWASIPFVLIFVFGFGGIVGLSRIHSQVPR